MSSKKEKKNISKVTIGDVSGVVNIENGFTYRGICEYCGSVMFKGDYD